MLRNHAVAEHDAQQAADRNAAADAEVQARRAADAAQEEMHTSAGSGRQVSQLAEKNRFGNHTNRPPLRQLTCTMTPL